jgi:Cys-tRNA(Pro) deacylase
VTTLSFERVCEYLRTIAPNLQPLTLQERTSTVEEAAKALGVENGQIAKSILFKAGETFGLFVTAGDVKVDLKIVKSLLNGKPKMATPEEVEEVTGYQVGGVCPFALRKSVPIFLDTSMRRFPVVYTAAGTHNSALPITFEQLQTITKGTEVEIAKQVTPTA